MTTFSGMCSRVIGTENEARAACADQEIASAMRSTAMRVIGRHCRVNSMDLPSAVHFSDLSSTKNGDDYAVSLHYTAELEPQSHDHL